MKAIDTAKLHVPKMFQPYSKIVGTSKCPKIANFAVLRVTEYPNLPIMA